MLKNTFTRIFKTGLKTKQSKGNKVETLFEETQVDKCVI